MLAPANRSLWRVLRTFLRARTLITGSHRKDFSSASARWKLSVTGVRFIFLSRGMREAKKKRMYARLLNAFFVFSLSLAAQAIPHWGFCSLFERRSFLFKANLLLFSKLLSRLFSSSESRIMMLINFSLQNLHILGISLRKNPANIFKKRELFL